MSSTARYRTISVLAYIAVAAGPTSAQQPTLTRLTSGTSRDWYPVWSADGSGILFSSNRNNVSRANDIWEMATDGSNQREIVNIAISTPASWNDPGLAPDKAIVGTNGDLLVLEEQDYHELMRGRISAASSLPIVRTQWDGNDAFFSDVLDVPGGETISTFGYSPATGQLAWIAAINGQNQLRIASLSSLAGNASDSAGTFVFAQSAAFGGLSFSPDGSKLVVSACPDDCSAGGLDIFILDLSTWNWSQPLTVTGFSGAISRQPRWSPAGNWIAFTSNALGKDAIWVVRPDGSGLQVAISDPSNDSFAPAWSPNGRDLAFTRNIGASYGIWLASGLVSTLQVTDAVANGGFELGGVGWLVPGSGSTPVPTISSTVAHSGKHSLCLGSALNSPEPTGYSAVYQWVTVPTGKPKLTFWYLPWTADSSIQSDGQEVQVFDSQGNYLASLMQVLEGDGVWKQATLDLSAYAGQQIALMFDVYQDGGGDPTGMCIDDISIPRSERPVVLIHGYCDSPSAFGNLADLLGATGISVYSFDYSAMTITAPGNTQPSCSVVSGADYNIEQIASCFGQFIQNVTTTESVPQVDIIAHSEGGSVTRAWMTGLSAYPYHGEIARLATIGTPHYGQAISKNAFHCSSLQPQELTYGSEFVSRLHNAWAAFQQSSSALPDGNLLFVAGTHGTGASECQSFLVGGPPCNDGLVDVISATLPTNSPADNIRYVPYQHCNGGLGCDVAIGDGIGEAHVTDSNHKTYQTLQQWLLTNTLPPQCCGSDTIDYTPSFITSPSRAFGLLLLRFKDAASNQGIAPVGIGLSFTPELPTAPLAFPGANAVTIVLPPFTSYTITIASADYKPITIKVAVSADRPTVPDALLMTHK